MKRLTRDQSREIDRRAVEELHLPSIVLMENAARALAEAAVQMLDGKKRVLIVCGGGNNGGDGYAVARHLHNRGIAVSILATKSVEELDGDAATNARVAAAMGLTIKSASPDAVRAAEADLIIDALLGTGLTKPPREDAAALIRAMNAHPAAVLAVDVPSGLDCDTGRPLGACVRADRTVTFVAEKAGFGEASARDYLGEVTVGDIGVPPELVEAVR